MVLFPAKEGLLKFWRKRRKWRICILPTENKGFAPQTPENDENDENGTPTVPEGHKNGVTTPEKPRKIPRTPAEPRRDPAESSERPRRALWEANFLGDLRGGLCPSDSDPPEL